MVLQAIAEFFIQVLADVPIVFGIGVVLDQNRFSVSIGAEELLAAAAEAVDFDFVF